MKEIAIKGDAFRKEEVIHALINIGGHNPYGFTGEREDCYYVLNDDIIDEVCNPDENRVSLFTLDQFRENFLQFGELVRKGDEVFIITDVRWLSKMGTMCYDAMQVASLDCFYFSDKDHEFGKYLSDFIIKQL